MHRAVLMAQGNHIDDTAILLPARRDPSPAIATAAPISPLAAPAIIPPAAPHYTGPAPVPAPTGKRNDLVGRTVEDVEKELILDTLTHCLGNRTQAAQVLGISIRTLRNKLKQYHEENPRTGTGN